MISFAAQNVPDAFRARTLLRAWLLRVAKREGHSIEQLKEIKIRVTFVPHSCFGVADAKAAINQISGGARM